MALIKILLILYIVKQQKPNFFWWNNDYKNAKIAKRSQAYRGYVQAYRGYVSTYNIETFNSFNPELQLQDIESII